MATKLDLESTNDKTVINNLIDSETVKAAFLAWLSEDNVKGIDLSNIIHTLDKSSERLLHWKISFTPLWEITKHTAFADVYKKALNNKFFRVMDRKVYSSFVKAGPKYLKFLKSKPAFHPEPTTAITVIDEHLTSEMTIKEAVIEVLVAYKRAMTAEEIYNRIIERGLYTFGAQNPINVVRNTIEYACENSGYTNKVAIPRFHYARNDDGIRIYSLLEVKVYQDASAQPAALDDMPVEQQDSNIVSSYPLNDIIDLDEGKKGIRHILEAHYQTLYGYSNISILWNAAQDTLSMFLNDNAINNADDLWRFIQRAFSSEYVLSNPHIWKVKPNYPQSFVGVVINLARQLSGTVTREQIDEYFARIKQGSPINATIIRQGSLMFYSNKHFILSEAVNPTNERCAAIAKSLDMLFEREQVSYIVLRDISAEWFSSLPTIKGGIKWTALLLQELLRLYPSIGYQVIFSGLDGQALDTLGAAVVPSKSEISGFADVVHRYCYERELLGKRMAAEDLRLILRNAGMIEGNELIYNLHKALKDYRFAFTDENRMVKILER